MTKKLALALVSGLLLACAPESPPPEKPLGTEESPMTEALEAGARLLQQNKPAASLDIYLVGFHPIKNNPSHQMEAHHFCNQRNQDLAQCALFDGNGPEANLNGIEYIISEKLYLQLPAAEKTYWHPHNYEILSGQLVAPGLPEVAEKELMRSKMNSYGKTWHVWNTGRHGQNDGDSLPLGEPMLAWSFNHDGEAAPGLVEGMEQRMQIKVAESRKNRQDLTSLARPQGGVEALAGKFPGPTRPLPGVEDSGN